jgi:hypothetical protein
MNSHRPRGIALAAALAVTSISAASSAIAANFDGSWTLVAQTTDGHCGVTRWDVAISGGQLYYPGGAYQGHPVGLTGVVSASGRVRVNVRAGPRDGSGVGRLGTHRGSGTWAGEGPSGTCSGTWTAARVQPGTADASPWNADGFGSGGAAFGQVPPPFRWGAPLFGVAPQDR